MYSIYIFKSNRWNLKQLFIYNKGEGTGTYIKQILNRASAFHFRRWQASSSSWKYKVSLILQWSGVYFALRQDIKVIPLDAMSSGFDVVSNGVLPFLARASKCSVSYHEAVV